MSRDKKRSPCAVFETIERRILLAGMPITDTIAAAIARVSNLKQYSAQTLRNAHEWAFELTRSRNIRQLQNQLGARELRASGLLDGVYIASFAASRTGQAIASTIAKYNLGQPAWPLVVEQVVPRLIPDDPEFVNQWHLQNTGQGGGTVGADADITGAWDNYLGDGVVIGIVDDGISPTHPDLAPNYRADLSWDFVGNDPDPSGGSHGVSVAGVAAARGNNAAGVSGAAPNAQLAGIRVIGATNDLNVSNAMAWKNSDISIYNNSWGPSDNGTVLGGAGPLTLAALANAIATGRNGLGTIYTWAAGNGGDNDNVNCDSYTNSRYTISVAAITNAGVRAAYSERGASNLVAAYSSGGSLGITTTAETSSYTGNFGGTSSAAPLVAGVIALMLEANPNLTWRDVQHILADSAEQVDPGNPDWTLNGAGHHVSHYYGYGGIDAQAAVALAQTWTNVAPEISVTTGTVNVGLAIPNESSTGISYSVPITDALKLETVELVFNATHANRGELQVILTSPSGTESVLLTKRPDTGDNFNNWVFTTKRLFDEDSRGTWTIRVIDDSGATSGVFNSFKLNLYGTHLDTTPAVYGMVYNDLNANGTHDTDEPGLEGVQVYIDADDDGHFDEGEPTTTTNAIGTYSIGDLALGEHKIRVIGSPSLRLAEPAGGSHTVDLSAGQNFSTGVNFGFVNARIAGVVINDINDNGAFDSGEVGMQGITVYIDADNSGTVSDGDIQTTTDSTGAYTLGGLDDGTYTVRIVSPAGTRQTAPAAASYTRTIAFGTLVYANDNFALTDRVRIGGTVYRDDNGNGAKDGAESPISGARVYQDQNNNGMYDEVNVTAPSSDIPKLIEDNSTLFSSLMVTNAGSITHFTVKVNITHTWDADLVISLISPQGTTITLCNRRGGSDDDFADTVFDDAAAVSIASGTGPFAGSYRPESPLSVLNGQSANGVWRLRVEDVAPADVGSLNSWSITFSATEPSVLTPASGEYAFAALPAGTHNIRQEPLANFVFTSPVSGGDTLTTNGGDLFTEDFGNFSTSYTGSQMYVRLDPTGDDLQIWIDQPTSGDPTYSVDRTLVNSLSFTGTANDDTLTIDAINGIPLPVGGMSFDGLAQGAAGDTFIFLGTTANEDVLFSASGLNVNSLLLNTTNVENAGFDGRGGGDDLGVLGGPTVSVNQTQHLTSLGITFSGSLSVVAGSHALLVMNSFQIIGKLDLNDNNMIVNYSDTSPLAEIAGLIRTARNGGAWNGFGITSSTAATRPAFDTSLGAIEATDFISAHGGATTFEGEPIDNTAVLVKYTYYGDTDFNGVVDGADYARVDTTFNQETSSQTDIGGWFNGDFDYNDKVDGADYALIDAAFNSQLGLLRPKVGQNKPGMAKLRRS